MSSCCRSNSRNSPSFIKSTNSQFISFISAFVSRLDGGSSLEQIQRELSSKNYSSSSSSETALIVKCRRAGAEECCVFDPDDKTKFVSSPRKADPVVSACCHCCSTSTNLSSSHISEGSTSEEQTLSSAPPAAAAAISLSDTFPAFVCSSGSCDPSCFDGRCDDSIPVYRAFRPANTRRSSLLSGGGDAFDITEYGFGSSSSLEYDEVAILDSGASKHFFGDRAGFVHRQPVNLSTVTADGSRVAISEQGDYVLHSEDAHGKELEPLVLRDVSILKGSPINLVSVGVLCDEGSTFHFEKGNSYFDYKGQRHRLIERDGLYLLRLDEVLPAEELDWLRECETQLGNCRSTEVRSKLGTSYACAASWDLWHERFGHADKKRLKFIYDNGGAEGMAVDGAKFKHDRKCTCPTCLSINNAKVHIGAVRKFADTVTRSGQLIYTDICGPFPLSVEGYRYVISFTGVYSRFSACYMLRKKSDSEAALKALIAFYARNGIIIQEIRSDQGGEFGGSSLSPSVSGGADAPRGDDSINFFFKRVCDEHKIIHVPMPAYRPELHGLAERWNLTVMKMANAMLFSARISHILWPSAVAHANLLRNRLPIRGLGPYTPYEIFFGKRPRVDQLRVWGCDAYKLLPTYPKIPG